MTAVAIASVRGVVWKEKWTAAHLLHQEQDLKPWSGKIATILGLVATNGDRSGSSSLGYIWDV